MQKPQLVLLTWSYRDITGDGCLSRQRSKYNMWRISIPKSHTLIGCKLKLIDLADSFKAPKDN